MRMSYSEIQSSVPGGQVPEVMIFPPNAPGSGYRVVIRSGDISLDIEDDFGNLVWWYTTEGENSQVWEKLGSCVWRGLKEGDIVKVPPQSVGRFTVHIVGECTSYCSDGLLGFEDEYVEERDEPGFVIDAPEAERDPVYISTNEIEINHEGEIVRT